VDATTTPRLKNRKLKDAIRREIQMIDQQTLKRVWENFRSKVKECINEDGHHLHDIIFKTLLKWHTFVC